MRFSRAEKEKEKEKERTLTRTTRPQQQILSSTAEKRL
jgi:hypothetical protein